MEAACPCRCGAWMEDLFSAGQYIDISEGRHETLVGNTEEVKYNGNLASNGVSLK